MFYPAPESEDDQEEEEGAEGFEAAARAFGGVVQAPTVEFLMG